MSIVNGQTISASDYITSSAGSGSSGQVPKLNSNGVLDPSFLSLSQSEVHASRALGTNYQNTTGHTLLVVVSASNTLASFGIQSYIGSSNPASSLYSEQTSSSSGAPINKIWVLAVVPKSYYYRVDYISSSSTNIDAWWEAQLPF